MMLLKKMIWNYLLVMRYITMVKFCISHPHTQFPMTNIDAGT